MDSSVSVSSVLTSEVPGLLVEDKAIVCPKAASKTSHCNSARVWCTSEVKQLYDGVFLIGGGDGDLQQRTYEALAKAPGSDPKLAENVCWTKVPCDFLLDKNDYKEDEWVDRHSSVGINSFDKQNEEEKLDGNKVPKKKSKALVKDDEKFAEFKKRLQRLRKNLVDVLLVEIGRMFTNQFVELVPDMECKSFEDFLVKFRSMPYDNKMRKRVHIASHTMWNWEKMLHVENALKEILKIKYGNLLSNGDWLKHNRRGGCISKIGTRVKQTHFIDKIRDAGRKEKKEIIYERWLSKKQPQDGVAKVIKTTTESHGFNGYIGLVNGHPDLIKGALASSTLANKALNESKKNGTFDLDNLDLETFIRSKMGNGNSVDDIMAEWSNRKKKDEVFLTLRSTGETASPLTQVSKRMSIFHITFFAVGLSFFCCWPMD